MAKSKRGRKQSSYTPSAKDKKAGGNFSWKYLFLGLCGIGLVAAGYGIYSSQNRAQAFEVLAKQGAAALTRVDTRPSEGRTHLTAGQSIQYGTNPPTSGPHYTVWVDPGFYDTAQSRVNLVHSLEHGMVVVYYDAPGDDVMSRLREWADLFTGPWSGIVVTRRAGLGEKIILTSWRRTLRLDRFDELASAAFIDAYRGRGPENPVR